MSEMEIQPRKFLISAVSVAIVAVFIAGCGFYFNKKKAAENGAYVRFEMEAYDKIMQNYWMKLPDSDLAGLFKLSLEKASGATANLETSDRAGAEKMLYESFKNATSTDAKKRLALNTLVIAIYSLQPAGRGGILSTSEEKAFRENVSNINRENDLYHDLGLQNGASE